MGKQGPCYHCGVTSTPLWRNGPPEKPVLCNACGSRWRTKGTLINYTPLHARSEPDEFEDRRVSKVKAISIKNKEEKLLKRSIHHENVVGGSGKGMLGGRSGGGFAPSHHYQSLHKGLDEDTSNRSSSGSAISNSDSCMQFGSVDVSDFTGPSQSSVVWDTTVPSRKRTCFGRPKQSSVEKLTRDLHTILHEQQSYFSGSSEEDLIFESDTPMVSMETGHGSVLIRHPNSTAREEESEASSLSIETKNEAYSSLASLPVYNAKKDDNFSNRGIEKSKMPMDQDQYERDDDEKLPIVVNHNSPLCKMDTNPAPPLCSVNVQRSQDPQSHSFSGFKSGKKIPKGVFKKASDEHEVMDKDGTAFSPRSLFALPPDNSNLMLDYLRYTEESSEHDVLLDVPPNSSFPQAELL